MTESKQAPKEFWLDENFFDENAVYTEDELSGYKRKDDFIHVIEYKAYEAEKQKVEKLCIAIRKVIEDAVIFDRLDANSLNRCINLMNRYGDSNG